MEKEVSKMSDRELHEEQKESKSWDRRYFEVESELEERE